MYKVQTIRRKWKFCRRVCPKQTSAPSCLLTGARFLVRICHKKLIGDDYIHAADIFSLVARKTLMVHNKTGITTSGGPREFSTGHKMAISPLWCSLMSVSLFNTLVMEVKDVGEIIDRVWIQTQCDFGYVETFPLWLVDASAFLCWYFGSGW